MPVQRIPRYNLLLRELAKHTWLSHPDFAALDASVERLAMFLNEKKREAEALQRTFHVQEILDKVRASSLLSSNCLFLQSSLFHCFTLFFFPHCSFARRERG